MGYEYDVVETTKDIYINSIIHYANTAYVNNQFINSYLIDRRFITDLENLKYYITMKYTSATIDDHDNYFLIFKVIGSIDFVDKSDLYESLSGMHLIMQLDDFVRKYDVKPRYKKQSR